MFWLYRYDCRGALSDLKSVEALPFGQSRWEGLSPEEKKIEQLCDEERYKSLNDKSEEESIYQGKQKPSNYEKNNFLSFMIQ